MNNQKSYFQEKKEVTTECATPCSPCTGILVVVSPANPLQAMKAPVLPRTPEQGSVQQDSFERNLASDKVVTGFGFVVYHVYLELP